MIAISYRREDSLAVAGRLYDRLQAKFGKQNVFMDFDSIPPGSDFREQIRQTIERSDLVIAVIGPHWLGEQGDSSRRIDDPSDFVRLEIECALKVGIPVIPLLVNNTPMPKADKLPPEIEALAFRNALPLDSGLDFHNHTDRLVNGISGILRVGETQELVTVTSAPRGHPPRWKILGWGCSALLVVIGVAFFKWQKFDRYQHTATGQQPTPTGTAEHLQSVAPQTKPQRATPNQDLSAGIHAQPSAPGSTQLPDSSKALAAKPKLISIQNCAVMVDGAFVRTVASVLGKPERIGYTHRGAEIDLWDSIGLRVIPNVKAESDSYDSFDIFVAGEEENRVTNSPEKNYRGELLIDGFTVSSTTNIRDLNASLGSKALTHTESYGGGNYPVYRGQYGEGGIQIICSSTGLVEIVSVFPRGLPKNEPPPETPEQRSAKTFTADFLGTVIKGDLNRAYQRFQHTPLDPKSLTLQGFVSFIREDEALSDIKSFRVMGVTSDMGLFEVKVEVTRSDGRKRNVNFDLIGTGERTFEVSSISSGPDETGHKFPNYGDIKITETGSTHPKTSITTDMVRDIARKFVSANQSYPPDAVVALYATKVQFGDEGEKDTGYIRQDLEKYHKRWPIRHDDIEGDIKVDEKIPGREYEAGFKLNFYVESQERQEWIKGQFALRLSVVIIEGELKISGWSEKTLHRETGKFSTAQRGSPEAGDILTGIWYGKSNFYDGKTDKLLKDGGPKPFWVAINSEHALSRKIAQDVPASPFSSHYVQTDSRTLKWNGPSWIDVFSVNIDGRTATYTETQTGDRPVKTRATLNKVSDSIAEWEGD